MYCFVLYYTVRTMIIKKARHEIVAKDTAKKNIEKLL